MHLSFICPNNHCLRTVRALIIDDESSVRDTTRTLLRIYCPEVEVLAEGHSVNEGIELIKFHQPELVFLDIEMQDGTGFDLLNHFPVKNFSFIFITAHDSYALKAFKFSAIDYILKPIDPDDLEKAIKKVSLSIGSPSNDLKIKTLLENQGGNQKHKKIILSDAESIYLVSTADIIRCESEGNYTRFHLDDKRQLLISTTLKEYEQLFANLPFFRPHQSHLVNLDHLSKYDKKEGGMIVMKDGSIVPVSVRKKDGLLSLLKNL